MDHRQNKLDTSKLTDTTRGDGEQSKKDHKTTKHKTITIVTRHLQRLRNSEVNMITFAEGQTHRQTRINSDGLTGNHVNSEDKHET